MGSQQLDHKVWRDEVRLWVGMESITSDAGVETAATINKHTGGRPQSPRRMSVY